MIKVSDRVIKNISLSITTFFSPFYPWLLSSQYSSLLFILGYCPHNIILASFEMIRKLQGIVWSLYVSSGVEYTYLYWWELWWEQSYMFAVRRFLFYLRCLKLFFSAENSLLYLDILYFLSKTTAWFTNIYKTTSLSFVHIIVIIKILRYC